MELSHKAAVELAQSVKKMLDSQDVKIDVVVCPSFPSLPAVAKVFEKSDTVSIGAQAVYFKEKAPMTSAVSVSQISPFAQWCLVGHSEQRVLWSLTDEQVRDSAALLIRHGISPVVCLGETAQERATEHTISRITQQVEVLLAGITRPGLSKMALVYEPVWAISSQGTGEMPAPGEVAEMTLLIRKLVAERFDTEAAEKVRVLYGGSVKPENVEAYVAEPGVDGVLPGSASLSALHFVEIIKRVQKVCS